MVNPHNITSTVPRVLRERKYRQLEDKLARQRRKRDAEYDKLKEMASQLDEALELYHALIENSPFGVLVHDGDNIIFCNKSAAIMLGAPSPLDLMGLPIWNLVHPSEQVPARHRISKVIDKKETAGFLRERLVRLDGSVIEVAVLGAPVILNKQVHSQVIILQDVRIQDYGSVLDEGDEDDK